MSRAMDPAVPARDDTVPTLDDTVPTRDSQRAWLAALRSRIAHIEFVVNDESSADPLLARLAHLPSTRTVGVGPGNGYSRARPASVVHRFAYDREILRALEELGGLFAEEGSAAPWTQLGDVDVVLRDAANRAIGATVTHERVLLDEGHDPGDETSRLR